MSTTVAALTYGLVPLAALGLHLAGLISGRVLDEALAGWWLSWLVINVLAGGPISARVFYACMMLLLLWSATRHDDDDKPRRRRRELGAKVRLRVFGPGFVPAAVTGTP